MLLDRQIAVDSYEDIELGLSQSQELAVSNSRPCLSDDAMNFDRMDMFGEPTIHTFVEKNLQAASWTAPPRQAFLSDCSKTCDVPPHCLTQFVTRTRRCLIADVTGQGPVPRRSFAGRSYSDRLRPYTLATYRPIASVTSCKRQPVTKLCEAMRGHYHFPQAHIGLVSSVGTVPGKSASASGATTDFEVL